MELINEHKIGVCKGTELEKDVKANFEGECAEVGEVLKTIAFEEAGHAAVYAEMNGIISSSLKENLETMLQGETMANNEKKASSKLAKLENIYPAHNFFDESSKDEARHARMLKGILERYF